MTQEELDALMNGDLDFDENADEGGIEEAEPDADEAAEEEVGPYIETDPNKYRVSALHSWPPPPPTDDNKMVHQLDDVTKESEEKATEIFDLIEGVSSDLADGEKQIKALRSVIQSNIELFETLGSKFPHVDAFKIQLDKNRDAAEKADNLLDMMQNGGDNIMNVMDIMQYQDIHRQKIERVINVMRALSSYMNQLFAGKIDDTKRVTSAVHLPGDSTTEDVVTSDDIEALLASFGQK